MRSWNLPLHVCTGVALMLATLVLLNDVYGDVPDCDGTIPGDDYSCGYAQDCPVTVDPIECDDSYCIENEMLPETCIIVGANSVMCENQLAVCMYLYYCQLYPDNGLCECTFVPVVDGNGNPETKPGVAGYLVECTMPGG